MRLPPEREALRQVEEQLLELLGVPRDQAKVRLEPEVPTEASRADAIIELAGFTFVVEWKSSSDVAAISTALEQAARWATALGAEVIPLVAVPYMGAVGRERCKTADMPWIDLSGNARIIVPGLRVQVLGQPNRFKRPGRPSSAFAPKSSRIARWLLIHPDRSFTQRELARATDVGEGFTSKIVSRLEEDGLVVREPSRKIRVRDPGLLLDAWRQDYDFSKHRILRGHVAARSGEVLLHRLTERLRESGLAHAATGLGAAWLLDRHAAFRLVTVYLRERPGSVKLGELGFRDEGTGANTWLVVPNDEGVFQGAGSIGGVRCAHPVQVYLDLIQHPERAGDAAEVLRQGLFAGDEDD